MKRFLTIFFCALSLASFAQERPLKFNADTFLFYSSSNKGGTLQIRNTTKDTLGFLYNKGNGVTEFRRAARRISPLLVVFGNDTLAIAQSNGLSYRIGPNYDNSKLILYEQGQPIDSSAFPFIPLKAGSGVTFSYDHDTLVINSTGGGSGVDNDADSLGGHPASYYVRYIDTNAMLQPYAVAIDKNIDSITSHNLRIIRAMDSIAAHNVRIGQNTADISRITDSITAHNLRIIRAMDSIAAHNIRIGQNRADILNRPDSIRHIGSTWEYRKNGVWIQYATDAAGGSAPDSSWNSAEFGYVPTSIGVLNQATWTSMPTNWALKSPSNISPTFSGAGMAVTGANFWYAPLVVDGAYGGAVQYSGKRMPYEKIDIAVTVVVGSKSAGNLIYITRSRNGLLYSSQFTFAWDLSNGPTSGRFGAGQDSLITFTTGADSTSKASFSIGDTLTLYVHGDGWNLQGGIINNTTKKRTYALMPGIWNSSGGFVNLGFIKGTYTLQKTVFSTPEETGKVWVFGDSHVSGSGASRQAYRFVDRLFMGNSKYYGIWPCPSLSTKYAAQGLMMQELIADAKPSKIIVMLGYNDNSEGIGAPAFKTAADSVFAPALRYVGNTKVFAYNIPSRNATTDLYNDSLVAYLNSKGITYADIATASKNGTARFYPPYYSDGVHGNDTLNLIEANLGIAAFGASILEDAAKDTSFVLNLWGIANARDPESAPLLVKDGNRIATVPNTLPTYKTFIPNMMTAQPPLIGQPLISRIPGIIGITGPVITNSYLMSTTPQGMVLAWANGLASSTSGTNFIATGGGNGSTGQPSIPTITGNGNFFLAAASAHKTWNTITPNWTGSDNNFINVGFNNTFTANQVTCIGCISNSTWSSISNNIGVGYFGLSGLVNGQNNINLVTNVNNGQGLGSDRSNSFIAGITEGQATNIGSNTWYYGGNAFSSIKYYLNNFKSAGGGVSWSLYGTASAGTNIAGAETSIHNSPGTGNASSGPFTFYATDPTTSGTGDQTTDKQISKLDRTGLVIGNGSALTKDASALLDLQSTVSGLRLMNMTKAQRDAIPSPGVGLAIFQTDNTPGVRFWNGTNWMKFSETAD